MRASTRAAVLAVVALLACAAVATAATFDPETGKGFVAKGKVQKAFGWTSADLQQNVDQIFFTFDYRYIFTATCAGVTTTQFVQTMSSLRANQRVRGGRVVGWDFDGYGSFHQGIPPEAGQPCAVDGQTGVWSDVTFIGSTAGEFYVMWRDDPFSFEGPRVLLETFPPPFPPGG